MKAPFDAPFLPLETSMRSVVSPVLALLAVLGLASLSAIAEEETAQATEPLVLVGEPLRRLALPLSDDLVAHLVRGRWAEAAAGLAKVDTAALDEGQRGDLAFLRAWCLVHTDRARDAIPLLDQIDTSASAPPDYLQLVRGEILLAKGDGPGALLALQEVSGDAAVRVRAAVAQAEVLRDLSRTQEAFAVYEELAKREDPSPGGAIALLALAKRHGPGSPEAYPYLRRLNTWYPGEPEAGEARQLLSDHYPGTKYRETWQEAGIRAERLMEQGAYEGAIAVVTSRWDEASDDSIDACRYRFVRGRSQFKKNALGEAVAGFADAGTRCVNAEGDYGPRSLYLQGTAEHRRGNQGASWRLYRQLVDNYPTHTMADDALTRGGISMQEGGDLAGARKVWEEALQKYPDGDTVPEAAWRLAFSFYLEGRPAEAIAAADRLAALPPTWDAVHVDAGRYWSARWKLYPDVNAPTVAVTDPAAKEAALDAWESLVRDAPWSFYAILAYARLKELAPERAAAVAVRPPDHQDGSDLRPWRVRLAMMEDPAVERATDLARLALMGEAKAEFGLRVEEELAPEEMAWWIELRIACGDWLYAHDAFRQYLKTHPIHEMGERRSQVVRVAWPDRYWNLVQEAAADDRYPPRLFHALVREESNFNKSIVSFAGARGLSQLMPATAKQTAGWLGMQITMDQLDDPATNLKIGARYLDAMHKQMGGSPYLALASYNAGAGRQEQWLKEWGNIPTDEYVERIPFRETRDYVKRVMGTYQTMQWFYDVDREPFWDLSEFNHVARPDKEG